MEHDAPRQWSDKLRRITRETLQERPLLPDGMIHMKHVNGGYGFMVLVDLLAGRYEILAKTSGETFHFTGVEAVIEAGWVVD